MKNMSTELLNSNKISILAIFFQQRSWNSYDIHMKRTNCLAARMILFGQIVKHKSVRMKLCRCRRTNMTYDICFRCYCVIQADASRNSLVLYV